MVVRKESISMRFKRPVRLLKKLKKVSTTASAASVLAMTSLSTMMVAAMLTTVVRSGTTTSCTLTKRRVARTKM